MTKSHAVLFLLLLLGGCTLREGFDFQGRLYTNIVQPASTDFHASRIGSKQCILDEYQLREPVSGYGITVEWSADRVLAAARGASISTISLHRTADLSYLFGIYKQQRLIIHGD